jgi:hypothetical protein
MIKESGPFARALIPLWKANALSRPGYIRQSLAPILQKIPGFGWRDIPDNFDA